MTEQLQRWARLKAMFHAAVEQPPAERAAFLASACGQDQELRAEVESLLEAHDDQRPFLEQPPVAAAARSVLAGVDAPDASAPGLTHGSRIGQYEVLEPLGAGGMGEVYRARDTKLDRFVALKIVRDSERDERSAERVFREARAASALNHPHICTIYEVGGIEGRPYLAMEYIAGQPLSAVIRHNGLPVQAVVTYGAQVADALAHAHEHRVVHRDLKADNIVVTPEGRAKVLDFGLARRLPADVAAPAATLTQVGAIAGTPAYMAPELLRGRSADARSDIWALGVLLYEMASGQRPFTGSTPFEVSSAILKDRPPPLPAHVPAGLQAIIWRCLARDPADRYQHAIEVKVALESHSWSSVVGPASLPHVSRRRLIGAAAAAVCLMAGYAAYDRRQPAGGPLPVEKSVAVLPFKVLSNAQEIGFVGLGLPDSIISRLALVRQMRVRPTGAVLSYEKANADPQQAGRSLGVEYIVAGTVSRTAAQIQLNTELVRVADGVAIWTHRYVLSATDILEVPDEIAEAIVDALEIQLTSDDRARVYRQYTQDPEAYALYLRGRAQLARSDPESTAAAVESFQRASDRDPDYPLAHAGLALASARMRLFFAPEAKVASWEMRAHRAAQTALRLDSGVAEAHEALAAVYRSAEFDWHQAIEEGGKALMLNPNLDEPHLYRASGFSHLGLLDRVPPEARAAMEINPANTAEPLRVQGVTAMFDGRFAEAVTLLEEARRASGKLSADWNLANAYYYSGRQTEAEAMLRDLRGSARSERRAQATLASFLAARRETVQARKLIRTVMNGSYMDHHVAYALGAAYAQLDEPTEAIRWLTQARATGFPCYPWFERDPLLVPLKRTAAFQRFLEEFKRSWDTAGVRHGSAR